MYENEIPEILKNSKSVAIIGLSRDPTRDSYKVASFLQSKGYRVIPVNPEAARAGEQILGEKAYRDLFSVPERVDIVDVFTTQEKLESIVQDAVVKGAKVLWTQIGIIDNEAEALAQRYGIKVVMNRCIMLEHRNLGL
ncbi:MAG: CoA-binding protein [Candidatus Micrarchaeota archaeon]